MNTNDETRLRDYLRQRFGGYHDTLSQTDSLTEVVDSLGLFDLVEFIEREFGVAIPNEEFSPRRFASIEGILEFVEELRAG